MVRFLRSWQGVALIVVILGIAGGLGWWLMRPPAIVDPLAALKQNGVIVVGARTAAPPFSSLDETHAFAGFEPDIAKALAGALGVKATFVAVDETNALDFLKRHVVDFVILPRGGAELREPSVRAVEPGYFASGFNAVAMRESAPKTWDALKGQPVCGLKSDAGAEQIVEELGGTYIGFADRDTALQALTAERCAVLIGDEVVLAEALKGDVDQRFTMAFDTIDVTPWTIAVRAKDQALGDFIAKQLTAYHQSGFLIERASTWSLPSNQFLETMHANPQP